MVDLLPLHEQAKPHLLADERGTYALVLRPKESTQLTLASIGTFCLPPTQYIYVGSALGPGGIRARVARHLRQNRRVHWHIDVLTQICPVEHLVWLGHSKRLECSWVEALLTLPRAQTPIPGFGSTDCANGCPAHLVQLGCDCDLLEIVRALKLKDQAYAESVLLPLHAPAALVLDAIY